MKGVSLHHHSTFSYMDGLGTPREHVERAAELGMSALALTEHGNVTSHVQLEKEANKAGIKPIFGLEAYTAFSDMREQKNVRKHHLTILAADQTGYRNLMEIVTESWRDGFYMWPTVLGESLAAHQEGLIVLSGCADSLLANSLLGGKGIENPSVKSARRVMSAFHEMLGDRFYLECQQFPELDRTHQINTWYEQESRRTGIPLVATADVHYPQPDDNKLQAILHTAGRGGKSVQTTEAEWEYNIRLTHPISDKVWLKRLRGTGLSRSAAEQALESTSIIAERCNVEIPKATNLRFPLPDGYKDVEEYVWALLRKGWAHRIKVDPWLQKHPKQGKKRVKYEMSIIKEKGFLDYFAVLAESVIWCKDRGIAVGPARGSAAGSLVCYLMRITEINPMPFPNVIFERFIDLNRTDLPDVDLDFDDDRRHELVTHVTELYGPERVGNVGTFTKYKGKNSLEDVSRAFMIPKWKIEPIKDLVIERSGGDSRGDATLEDTVMMFPTAKKIMEEHPVLEHAYRLEGNYKSFSVHASGLIISNAPLTDSVAYYTKEDKRAKKMRQVLSVDKYDAEYLNMMKMDFLGLKTMGVIGRALEFIGMELEEMYVVANPTIKEDPKVIDAFRRNDVVGVFQYGGSATKVVNGDVAPDNFLELCDINALSRPGPLHSGSTADYVAIKHGRKQPDHIHEVVDEITKHTKYCIIYQEQILQLVRQVGGFDWTHAQEIRKIISLKHGEAAFNMKVDMFIEGAQRLHGMDEQTAMTIWRRLATAGTYAFNAAHCLSYSMLAYWTMWLKINYPDAFYAASLAKTKDKDRAYVLMRDAIKHDVEFLPPDRNKSGPTWDIHKGKVRAGLTQVPGIGDANAEIIIQDREERGKFKTWGDMQRVSGIGPAKMELIKAMTESDDPFGLHRVDIVLDKVREAIKDGSLGLIPEPTHRGADIPTDEQDFKVVYVGIPTFRNPQDVIEDERARTGEDYKTIKKKMRRPDLNKKMVLHCMDDSDATVFVRFSRYDFPKFEKGLWAIDLKHDVLIVEGMKRSGFGTGIMVKRMWVVDPNDLFEPEEDEDEED